MGNKKNNDDMASFFGDDDLDWLADEESSAAHAESPEAPPEAVEPASEIPVAVAPEPSATPLERMDGSELPEAEPLLPPGTAPAPLYEGGDEPEISVDLRTEATEEGFDPDEDDVPAPEEVAFADDFDERSEEIPLVRTVEPPPGRALGPAPDEGMSDWAALGLSDPPSEAAPPEAEPLIAPPQLLPPPDALPDNPWGALVAALMAEATATEGPAGASLLAQAADIALQRLGDARAAFALAIQAEVQGADSVGLWNTLSSAAMELQDAPTAYRALVACAERLEGAAAAERWREAAVLAGSHLGDSAAAGRHLQAAVDADPDDYVALRWLSDHLDATEQPEARVAALARLAELSPPAVAAEILREQGQVLLGLGRVSEARTVLQRSHEADPSYAPSFLALEALYSQGGDDSSLAELYRSEAGRFEGAERVWWLRRAAQALRASGDTDAARELLEQAIELGDLGALRTAQVLCQEQGDAQGFAALCGREAVLREALGTGVSFAHYRHGQALEAVGDGAGALAAYRTAVAVDPSAGPAAEAVARLLKDQDDLDGLAEFWADRIAKAEDLSIKTALLLRLGEIAETAGDQARARDAFRAAIAVDPGFCSALEGLLRVATRLEDWAEVADVHEQRAAHAVRPDQQSLHIYRSGRTRQRRLGDAAGARDCFERVLRQNPAHPAALDALLEVLELSDDWEAMGAALRAAGEHETDLPEKTSLLYRAGRIYADKTPHLEQAIDCLRACTMVAPDFLPAIGLLKELAGKGGASEEIYRLHRSEAQVLNEPNARRWRLLAAAEVAQHLEGFDGEAELQSVLDTDPRHPGALPLAELRAVASNKGDAIATLYRNATAQAASDEERVRWLTQMVAALAESGDAVGVADGARQLSRYPEQPRPVRGVARLLAGQQFWDDASRLLAQASEAEDKLERARLLQRRLSQPGVASEILAEVVQSDSPSLRAAHDLTTLIAENGSSPLLMRAHDLVTASDAPAPMRAAHALWAAAVAEDLGEVDKARDYYRQALALRSASREAMMELERVLIEQRDQAGLEALFEARTEPGPIARARVLEEGGLVDKAADVLVAHTTQPDASLADLLEGAQMFRRAERWRESYAALERALAAVHDAGLRDQIEAELRELLAEHLYQTDEAWTLYQRLHEQNPADREVTRALARIAGARGEVELGLGFLADLASGAQSPTEAADLALEIAEIYATNGQPDRARQACLDALDHVPSDERAMSRLKQMALDSGDHEGLVSVLRREASMLRGEPQVAALRQIATVIQEHNEPSSVVLDAWRGVLDVAPLDGEALRASTRVAAAIGDWAAYMDLGQQLLPLTTDSERADLLCQLGIAAQDHLFREDGAAFFEKALANTPPSVEAAVRLERLCRQYGDLAGAVRCILVQAEGSQESSERVRLLAEAASIEATMNHNRDAAATLYGRLLEIEPEHVAALEYRARFLLDAGDPGALELFERLEPRITQGKDMEDFDVRMDVSLFFHDLARLLAAQGRVEDAIPRYDRALELNPTHLPTLEAVAPLYMERELWRKAERVLRQLLQLTGGHGNKLDMARTYTSLGLVERALGHQDKAAKRFNKALELSPNHLDALKGMALVLEDQKDWNTALNFYNNIIYQATVPADVIHAYMTKGRILDEHIQNPEKAAQHYERSLAFDANQPVVLLRLAELAMRRGEWAEAGGLVQRGLRLEARPTALRSELLLGWAAARQASGDDRGAQAALAEALATTPALRGELGPTPLENLPGLVAGIRKRLPR